MKEREYNLRFIPFGFCRPFAGELNPLKQLQDLTRLVQERIDALKKVFKRLECNERISNEDLHNTDISGTTADFTNVDSEDILTRKLNQLYINNRVDPACSSFPLRNNKIGKRGEKTVEAEFNYHYKTKPKSSNKLAKGFFGGFGATTTTSHSTVPSKKSGIIILSTEVPKEGLPYVAPSLLKKTNKLDKKSEQNQENWANLQASLPDEDKKVLKSIDINLTCIQANNSEIHVPPQIQSVTTELVCMTVKSINSIPIKLTADLLLKKEKFDEIQRTFDHFREEATQLRSKFEKHSEELNDLFTRSRRSDVFQALKFSDFLPDQLMTNIESICSLRADIRSLHGVFKKQSLTLDGEDQDELAVSKNASSTSILSGTFSGSSSNSTHVSTADKMKKQLLHDWVKSNDAEYQRVVTVNLQFSDDIKETLVPNFESCLISRLYCVRTSIKFEGQVGVATIEVPVQIRMLES